ncbi:MAG: ATP-binding protein, partial [Sulfuricella sp.]|nr:ATP-binding protein [Sulfuricella sp.]
MFRLLDLEVVHWDYWRRFTVPLEASIVTIVGPNGSGKTTLLDALRTLLALDCSKKRDYKRYARKNGEEFCWLRGVVDNSRSPAGGHPFFPILTEKVTLACRIEKKGGDWARQYCIAEGETAIEHLQEAGVWMGVREYQRRLHEAGLTPAITQVLSLEQGQTDKLCELSPKALLDLVFQVFSDKQALERYQEAREHHLATERELKEIDGQLARLEARIELLTGQVNRYIQWREINQERVQLASEIRPRLEYMQLLDSIRGARAQLTGARREWRAKRAEETALADRIPALEGEIGAAETALNGLKERELADITMLNAASKEVGRLEQLLKERERLARLAAEAGASDPEAAQKRLGEAERDRAGLDAELAQLRREQKENQELLTLLEAGRRADPPDVGALRAALDGAGIDHDTLPEIVELRDEGWQAAVEAALAPLKHIVLLRRDGDRAAAWSIGEKLRYRHFIVPERADPLAPTPGSLLEVVHFTRPAPLWLMQTLDRTQRVEDAAAGAELPRAQDWITRSGYLRERRGGRHAGQKPADWHFGRARLAALKA